MRALIATALVILCAAAAPASAQGLHAGGLRRLPGMDAMESSPIQRLKADARAWIGEERARRKVKPGDLDELAVNIELEIGPAIMKLAKREQIGTGDLILAIMYEIMSGASNDLDADLRRMRKAGAIEAEIQAATTVKADLDAKVAEVVKSQTVVSRSLLPDLAAQGDVPKSNDR